jgi:hypothetical protein
MMRSANPNPDERSEDIYFQGMNHAPENEQGVVFLFAKVHRLLGFKTIDVIKTGFPDCWALHRTASKTHRTWIEFEFKSKGFKEHENDLRHLKPRRGYVVCWEHDWPECEKYAEVIDLRRVVGVGKKVWVQPIGPKYHGRLNDTPKRLKEHTWWTVAYKAKPGDIVLLYRSGTRTEAKINEADPNLLHSITNIYEVTSFPKYNPRFKRHAYVRQITELRHPLYWGAIKSDSFLSNAPWVRASMQGRPDVTAYWWRLHQRIEALNPHLKKNSRFTEIGPKNI